MRRVFWAALGLGAGAAIGVGVMRWAERTREALTPKSVVGTLLDGAADWRERLAEALDAGREAMAEREDDLRERYGELRAGIDERARARHGADG